eukprot:UN12308
MDLKKSANLLPPSTDSKYLKYGILNHGAQILNGKVVNFNKAEWKESLRFGYNGDVISITLDLLQGKIFGTTINDY